MAAMCPNLHTLKVEYLVGQAFSQADCDAIFPPLWMMDAQADLSAIVAAEVDFDVEAVVNFSPDPHEIEGGMKKPKSKTVETSMSFEFDTGLQKRIYTVRYGQVFERLGFSNLLVAPLCSMDGSHRMDLDKLDTVRYQLWVPGRHHAPRAFRRDKIIAVTAALMDTFKPKELVSPALTNLTAMRESAIAVNAVMPGEGVITYCRQMHLCYEVLATTDGKTYEPARRFTAQIEPNEPSAQIVPELASLAQPSYSVDWELKNVELETFPEWESSKAGDQVVADVRKLFEAKRQGSA